MEARYSLPAVGGARSFCLWGAEICFLSTSFVDSGRGDRRHFSWTLASPIYIWIALVLAGASMFLLARRWFDRRDATFAAVLYAVNPYHLVIVYWRSAFAELLASCLVPLLLLLVLRLADGDRRAVAPLGFLLAASWLTNAPAAVMIHYSLALLVLFFAWKRKSPSLLLTCGGAVLLGACLAAFYLLPAIYEQRWVEIANAVSQGSRPVDNFLFIHTTDPDHDAFNKIISWVALLEMIIVTVSAVAARRWRETQRELWIALAGWAIACGLLMFQFLAAMEHPAEDGVYAVPVAMAALPQHDLCPLRDGRSAACADARGRVRSVARRRLRRLVSRAGPLVGHARRSA